MARSMALITKTVLLSLSSLSQPHAGKQALPAADRKISTPKRAGGKTCLGLIQIYKSLTAAPFCHNLTFSVCTTEAPAVLAPRDLACTMYGGKCL